MIRNMKNLALIFMFSEVLLAIGALVDYRNAPYSRANQEILGPDRRGQGHRVSVDARMSFSRVLINKEG